MGGELLVARTAGAAWLPNGSTAEVWVGDDCAAPEPSIIVRLLLVRGDTFFCVPSTKGLDLPTLYLGRGAEQLTVTEGLRQLLLKTVGQPEAEVRCVGYVRNVVPTPDDTYPHSTPLAHVPVFAVVENLTPVVPGGGSAWMPTSRNGIGGRSRLPPSIASREAVGGHI